MAVRRAGCCLWNQVDVRHAWTTVLGHLHHLKTCSSWRQLFSAKRSLKGCFRVSEPCYILFRLVELFCHFLSPLSSVRVEDLPLNQNRLVLRFRQRDVILLVDVSAGASSLTLPVQCSTDRTVALLNPGFWLLHDYDCRLFAGFFFSSFDRIECPYDLIQSS